MQVNVHAPFKISEKIDRMVRQRLNKLQTYFDRIVSADVYFKEEADPAVAKQVEIKLWVPGPDLFAASHSDTYEKAIAEVVGKLRKQLIRYKDKLNQRH